MANNSSVLKACVLLSIFSTASADAAEAEAYGRKICRRHIDKYCASQALKPGYSCAMCAGHYWKKIKPYCNPHNDKTFDINSACESKTENRLIRHGTHEHDQKAVCVKELAKHCAKDNGKLPRDHQKVIWTVCLSFGCGLSCGNQQRELTCLSCSASTVPESSK